MGLKLYCCGMSVLIKGRTPLEFCIYQQVPPGVEGAQSIYVTRPRLMLISGRRRINLSAAQKKKSTRSRFQ